MEDVELTPAAEAHRRLAPLALRVTTSARRWEQNGVARTIAPHVDAARPLLLRGRAGPPAPLVLRRCRPAMRAGGASGSAPVVLHRARRASRHRRHRLIPSTRLPRSRRRHREQEDDQRAAPSQWLAPAPNQLTALC